MVNRFVRAAVMLAIALIVADEAGFGELNRAIRQVLRDAAMDSLRPSRAHRAEVKACDWPSVMPGFADPLRSLGTNRITNPPEKRKGQRKKLSVRKPSSGYIRERSKG